MKCAVSIFCEPGVFLQGSVLAVMLFPIEMIDAQVAASLCGQLIDVFVVSSFNVIAPGKQFDCILSVRCVVQEDLRMVRQNDAL